MRTSTLAVIVALGGLSHIAHGQLRRTQDPKAAGIAAGGGLARDPQHPYAGMWAGVRTMPIGNDDIRFRFGVADDKYTEVTLHPGGAREPQKTPAMNADGLTWESPNSGGGTWVYKVHLASPDSMVGTIVLRDAPPNLQPAPQGTMVLKRQPPERTRQP